MAILNGKEEITIELVNDAYNSRMQFMQEYIQPTPAKPKKQTSHQTVTVKAHDGVKEIPAQTFLKKTADFHSVQEVITFAQENSRNMMEILREFCAVEVV
mgnify:CR=1 FL=1